MMCEVRLRCEAAQVRGAREAVGAEAEGQGGGQLLSPADAGRVRRGAHQGGAAIPLPRPRLGAAVQLPPPRHLAQHALPEVPRRCPLCLSARCVVWCATN
jgi:hypothetical protein